MKIKLDSIENLAKAMGSLGSHFKKAAEHHTEMAKAHGEHGAFLKGKHDAMADDEMHKAAFGKMAEHHVAVEKLHKAAADHYGSMAEEHGEEKAAADTLGKTAAAAAAGADDKVVNIGAFLNTSALEVMGEIGKTKEFKDLIGEYVMKAVKESLGQVVPPMTTKAVGTVGDPAKGTLVPRPGEELPKLEKAEAPPELAHFFN